ncbi:hypothetical protein ON010_g5208 [Phytophthora cinnamomi]|nr:hypothetical protein ON010_g5208 [Phytophthora cinnamomi]
MLSSKTLAACALAAFALGAQADEYTSDNYDDQGSSYYADEGSNYYDEGSSYYDDGSSYYSEGSSYYTDESSNYYVQGSNYYDEGSSYYGDYSALPAFAYKFDPEYSAGVSGTINVQYAGPFSTFAVIKADLDFSDVDQSEIMAFNGNCTAEVTQYKWHIHVKWPNDYDSESFEKCALPITGNHYDPLKACSPDSEFAGTPECQLKSPLYNCNPDAYGKNPLVCEKGDLAGKLGLFELDGDKKVMGEWYDPNYPQPSENTPEWNIILHAVCGKVAPRIACAVGRPVGSDWSWSSTSGSYYRH